MLGQIGERHVEDTDVIGGGVRAGTALAEKPGECLARGDLGPIEKAGEGMKAIGVLPGGSGELLVGMGDHDRRIEI